MQAKILILAVVFLAACSGGRQNRLDEIKEKEKIVMKSYDEVPDKSTSESLRQDYLEFAKDYPEDSLAPKFMHKAAELAVSIDMPADAIITLDELISKYPDYEFLPDAMFFKGFILESHLKDIPSAKKAYEDFLKRFPKHELAAQVRFALDNLGKSPDELVEEFMKRTEQVDSLAFDSAK